MEKPLTKVVSEWIAEEFQLQWVVKNFSLVKCGVGNFVDSPELQTYIAGELTKWTIRVYPYYYSIQPPPAGVQVFPVKFPTNKMVSVHLILNTEMKTLIVSFELLLINFQGEQIAKTYFSTRQFCKGTGEGFCTNISGDDLLQRISPADTLRIIFNLKVSSEVKNCYSPTTDIHSSIIDVLAKLRLEADFSDLSIMVSGREFHAHKSILAVKSPVLSSMFKNNMKETKIEISDITPEVFEEFLAFLYTGKANIKDYAKELFAAADKYDVQNLRAFCENEIIQNINHENFIEILIFSDLLSSKKLKEKCLNFMVNAKIKIDKNKLAPLNNQSLMMEIIEAFLVCNK